MQPLKLRDQEMKRIEQAYQDLKKTSAKNKQLPEELITDVRCLQTITKAKPVKRADMFIRKYGEPLTLASPSFVATRDSPSKLGLSSRCSKSSGSTTRSWPP